MILIFLTQQPQLHKLLATEIYLHHRLDKIIHAPDYTNSYTSFFIQTYIHAQLFKFVDTFDCPQIPYMRCI